MSVPCQPNEYQRQMSTPEECGPRDALWTAGKQLSLSKLRRSLLWEKPVEVPYGGGLLAALFLKYSAGRGGSDCRKYLQEPRSWSAHSHSTIRIGG
jgi:hypothetical protein